MHHNSYVLKQNKSNLRDVEECSSYLELLFVRSCPKAHSTLLFSMFSLCILNEGRLIQKVTACLTNTDGIRCKVNFKCVQLTVRKTHSTIWHLLLSEPHS